MAFTEATLVAQLDAASTGRTITIERYTPGAVLTDIYATGVTAPYAGKSRWMQIDSTLTAAQAAAAIQAAIV